MPAVSWKKLVEVVGGGEFAPVDRQQILAVLDVDARLRERRLEFRVPVLAVEDVFETVAAVGDLVVGAQQSDFDLLDLRFRAAAHPQVADDEIADHFAEQIVQVAPAGHPVEKRRINPLGLLQVQPVKVRVVEEIAFDAPDLVIHLPPLGRRVNIHFHVVQFERALAGFRRLGGIGDIKSVVLAIQHFLAVGGQAQKL